MNTSEAAKAFLAFAYPETKAPMNGVVFNGEKFVYELDGHEAYTQKFFELFCAGIAHAEEMRKPPVVIEHWHRNNTFSVKRPKGQAFRNIQLGFPTREDAAKWAVGIGYRVLD